MPLCLQFHVEEKLVIKGPTGEEIWIRVDGLTVGGMPAQGRVSLSISAPMNYTVDREKVYDKRLKKPPS